MTYSVLLPFSIGAVFENKPLGKVNKNMRIYFTSHLYYILKCLIYPLLIKKELCRDTVFCKLYGFRKWEIWLILFWKNS